MNLVTIKLSKVSNSLPHFDRKFHENYFILISVLNERSKFVNLKKLVLSSLIAIIMPISAFSESRTALDEAPLGLQLDDIFTPTEMQNNSAKVYRNGNGTDVVIITDDGGQQGGLWSTEAMKLDLSQDFHASMKIYFDDVGSNSADGAAFVMHSDPKGLSAFSFDGGQTLGVYGYKSDSNPERGAVQNSFAIEFDTYRNDSGENQFDNVDGLGDNHVASSYPGLSSSYERVGSPKRNKIYHDKYSESINLEKGALSNGKWHDFSFNYSAETHEFTYIFDGIERQLYDGLDTSVFGTNSVYWGFTGSTGKKESKQAVIFENIPGLVDAKVTEQVLNKKNESLLETEVTEGETVSYQTDIAYIKGKQSWRNLKVTSSGNQQVTPIAESINILLPDGSKYTPKENPFTEEGNLNLDLTGVELSDPNQHIQISYDAVIKKGNEAKTRVLDSIQVAGSNNTIKSQEIGYWSIPTKYEFVFDEVADISTEITGKLLNTGDFEQVDLQLSNAYLSDGNQINSKAEFDPATQLFKLVLEEGVHLLAEEELVAQLTVDNEVIPITKTQVVDKMPPTAEGREVYMSINEDFPSSSKFVRNLMDTNKHLQPEDFNYEFNTNLNEIDVSKAGEHQIELTVADKAGNKSEMIHSTLKILEANKQLESKKQLELKSKDLIQKTTIEKNEFLLKQLAATAWEINAEAEKIDLTEQIIIQNSDEITENPGEYTIKLAVPNKNLYREVPLIVTDGELKLEVDEFPEMDAQIVSRSKKYSFPTTTKFSITDERVTESGRKVSVSQSGFTIPKGYTGSQQALNYLSLEMNNQESASIASQGSKEIVLNDVDSDLYFSFIVKKGANNYLSKNDKYSNEITWTMMKDNTLQLSKLNVTTPLKK